MKKIILTGMVLAMAILTGCGSVSYEKAYEKTEKLKNYELYIETVVTISDAEGTKTTTIGNSAAVENAGEDDMIYEVKTQSVTVGDNMSTSNSESAYIYYDGKYYFTLPGVKYYSSVEPESAAQSIEGMTSLITFEPSEMKNVTSEENEDGSVTYFFSVDGDSLSDYVMSLLQNTANTIGDVSFSPKSISASAEVADGYVTQRGFEAIYEAESGESFEIDIDVELKARSASVEKPKDSDYIGE
ncbi:MAG: hypothetical protein LUG52_08695 [Clostridia bacterium]|nr:hypothetical protein [Clostridia bacterium]